MLKRFFIFLILVIILNGFNASIVLATPTAPYFQLVASQGQGAGSNAFYQGRCLRVDIYLNTGGRNANGADVEINYNNTILQAVQSNCSTAATSVYDDGLFNAYPSQGNSITSNKLKISAYNNPGVSTNVSNGLYGHMFFKVLSGVGDYTLGFQFTASSTIDTNLAETNGDGSDILAAVGNLGLFLDVDTDSPAVNSKSPTDLATGVAINSNVSFSLYDAMAGVSSTISSVRMREGSGTWYSQTVSFGSPLSTNQNRYYQYDSSVSPNSNIKNNNGYYQYNKSYTVETTVGDLGSPSTHSQVVSWSFTTEDDAAAPYVDSRVPVDNASGVSTSTNITFNIKDYKSNAGVIGGVGVNTNSITIVMSSPSIGSVNLNCSSAVVTCVAGSVNNIAVTINPSANFAENELVTVTINASDLHSPANAMVPDVFSFTTADTIAPIVNSLSPAANSYGNFVSTNVNFHLVDSGAGVNLSSLQVLVDGVLYTPNSGQMTVSGDASNYAISINPSANFTASQAVVVKIVTKDQAASQNYTSPNPYEYNFIVGLGDTTTTIINGTCPSVSCGGGGVIYIKEPQTCPAMTVCEKSKNTTTTVTLVEKITEKQDCNGVTKEIIKNVFVSPVNIPVSSSAEIISSTIGAAIDISNPDVINKNKTQSATVADNFKELPWILLLVILFCVISEIFFKNLKVARLGYIIIMGTVLLYWMFVGFKSYIDFDNFWHKSQLSVVETAQIVKKVGEILPIVSGSLVDLDNGKPLINYMIAVDEQKVFSDNNGKFVLRDVDNSNKIKISGVNIGSPIYVDIAGRKNLDIKVDFGMFNFISQISQNYQQNKFKSLYSFVNTEDKIKISADEFVDINNQNLIAVNKKYSITDIGFDYEVNLLKNWQSKQTKQKYAEVYKVNLVRHVKGDNGDVIIKEPVYMIKTDSGNKLVI